MADTNIERLTDFFGALPSMADLPVAASTIILKGTLVALSTTGFAIPASSDSTVAKVLGRAASTVDNRLGADGELSVHIQYGTYGWDNSAGADEITIKEIGQLCYAVDNQTVAKTGTVIAGVVVDVRDDQVRVWSSPLAGILVEEIDE